MKKWSVTLRIESDDDATQENVEEFINGLEWIGGNLEVVEYSVTRTRRTVTGALAEAEAKASLGWDE